MYHATKLNRVLRSTAFAVFLGLGGTVVSLTAHAELREFRGELRANEELFVFDTRPGVRIRVLITRPAKEVRGMVLFFPGGNGVLVNSSGGLYGAFRREFAAKGFVMAIIDVPSDYSGGLGGKGESSEDYRVSAEFTRDGRIIFDQLYARWSGPTYLMGHSMGTISAAHLAASLEERRLTGLILFSSPSRRGPQGSWISLPSADLGRIRLPVVLAHHRDDGCRGAQFTTAEGYLSYFNSSSRVGFIEVTGGESVSSNPCSGSNQHSFYGRRVQVVDAVIRWLSGENISRVSD